MISYKHLSRPDLWMVLTYGFLHCNPVKLQLNYQNTENMDCPVNLLFVNVGKNK